ncbi:ABC transporter permease [Phytohabitans sp. ZYX-F-186]|uniref:ABC transporter permease n=1 Tax=Phytohabitans maris TaxID=3071409 RepID=A0ABU0ZGB3_9ACTN|nr:ABC transporter permease [Phytohabitans sp. ZYX-F-186]MDQ7906094.1 ABC transporter permease [Phytohabitans sp. ZYX-F-186]
MTTSTAEVGKRPASAGRRVRPTEGRKTPGWVRGLAWKLLRLVISIWAVLTLTFLMIQFIPGDPVRLALGPDAPASLVEERRQQLGLDQPLIVQYFDYWGRMLTGDFGDSLLTQQPVSLLVEARIGNTATIVALSLVATSVVAILGGLLVGIATHRGRRPTLRTGFTLATGIAAALPDFLVAVGLVFLFAVTFTIFPVAGAAGADSFVLPTLAITLGSAATMMRVVRSSTAVVLDQDYLLVARAKRLPATRVYLRHGLPNLLTAALTLGGLQLGTVVTGTIVVENVFAIPGLGTALVQALITRDYPVVQTIMVLLAGTVLILNLLIDVALGALDPRSKRQRS